MRAKKNILIDFLIILLVLYMGSASILTTKYIGISIGLLVFVIHLNKQKTFNSSFLKLLVYWIIINVFAMVFIAPFGILRVFNNALVLLFLPYMVINLMGFNFWRKLEKFIYILTLISLPLYIMNNIFPGFFNSLDSVFSVFTKPALSLNSNYWSVFIYTNAFAEGSFGLLRNNGFMWEPGGFAMILIVALIYHLLTQGYIFNRKTIVYIISILTTFSTAGYFALIVLLSGFVLRKITVMNIVIVGVVIVLFSVYAYRLEFISGKVDTYFTQFEKDPTGELGNSEKKVNRFQGGFTAAIRTLKYPIGYGLISFNDTGDNEYSYGTNGLGSLLEMWGVLGFGFLILNMRRFIELLNSFHTSKLTIYLLLLALLIVFFSNPISRFVLVYFIIMTPIVMKSRIRNL